ncbi:hypothetical protein ACFL45_09540 [Candidatus Neomarinimicrobiota bacterium]
MIRLIAYFIFVVIIVLYSAYTLAFQGATLYWGKRIASDNPYLPTGLQDAITPPQQTRRNILMFILLPVALIAGFLVLKWYWAILSGLVVLISRRFAPVLFPGPQEPYYKERIISSLQTRRKKFENAGDMDRIEAVTDMLRRLNATDDDNNDST